MEFTEVEKGFLLLAIRMAVDEGMLMMVKGDLDPSEFLEGLEAYHSATIKLQIKENKDN